MSFFSGVRASLVSRAPESLLQQLRAFRRAELFRATGVAFVHVPRTGGTSVAGAIYGQFIGHFGLADLKAAAPADVVALPRFTFVRNPWDRAVSAWAFARAGGGDSKFGTIRINHPQRYAGPAFGSFESFVEGWLGARPLDRRDGVFRPQSRYLLDARGEMDFSHVGRTEAMANTEAWLSDLLHRRVELRCENASERLSYRTYYTPRLRNLVGDAYAEDVALLGYDF